MVVPQVTHVAPAFQQFSGVSMCAILQDPSRRILCHVRPLSERSADRRRGKASERVPVSPEEPKSSCASGLDVAESALTALSPMPSRPTQSHALEQGAITRFSCTAGAAGMIPSTRTRQQCPRAEPRTMIA